MHSDKRERREFEEIEHSLALLHQKVDHMARTLAEVQADLAGIKDDLAAISTKIDALNQQIADLKAAGAAAVTQDQLDQLAADADALKAQADAAAAK